jgi:hypothetical protein
MYYSKTKRITVVIILFSTDFSYFIEIIIVIKQEIIHFYNSDMLLILRINFHTFSQNVS